MNDETPDNVISFSKFKKDQTIETPTPEPTPPNSPAKAYKYEFHFFQGDDDMPAEVVHTEGYLKFGPQFIAVLDGPNPELDNVLFTAMTSVVKYIKKIDESGTIQGTLSV